MKLLQFPARRPRTDAWQSIHRQISVQTLACLQFIDLTDEIQRIVTETGIGVGTINVQTRHTTAAIVMNEHEPLLLEDLRATLERMAPRHGVYRHDDFTVRTANLTPDERPNGHAHCKMLLLRSSETVNIVNGRLLLGQWQRIFFVELDCARQREISLMVMGKEE
ncbi:MAG: secondary thiamine-phosphate synthase enzyme YjbQ [Blastocatellia bacterium]